MTCKHVSVEFWDAITELERQTAALETLAAHHLGGAAAEVRSMVQKRITAGKKAVAAVRGAA